MSETNSNQMVWILFGVMLCGIVIAITPVYAATDAEQIIYADKDAAVWSGAPTTNFGGDSTFLAGKDGSNYFCAYFHFPHEELPENFQSAEISIYYYSVSSAFYVEVIYRTMDNWDEYTLTWNNQPVEIGTKLSEYEYISASSTHIDVDVTDIVPDTSGITVCVNHTGILTGYVEGYTRAMTNNNRATLTYTYLVPSFRIPGYDIAFLLLVSFGIVVLLSKKYRNWFNK